MQGSRTIAVDMGSRLARWIDLSWRDRWRLLVCVQGLAAIHCLLAGCGFKRTRKVVELLSRTGIPHAASPTEIAEARALVEIVDIAGRHGIVKVTCLRRALLVYGWLRRRGLRPSLRLGVLPQGTAVFEAHAWIELDDVCLIQADEAYLPFRASKS